MLKKENRFHGRVSLLRVFRSGRTTRGRSASLRFIESRNFRAAVVVSKKVSKSAVVRNRIRRRVFAYIESSQAKLKVGDYVVSVFDQKFETASHEEVTQELDILFKKANVLIK